jgi:hypothetical protein
MTTTTFQINGHISTSSAAQLAWALSTVGGVGSADIDAKTGTVILSRRRGMDPDIGRAHAVVRATGFEVASPLELRSRPRLHERLRHGTTSH